MAVVTVLDREANVVLRPRSQLKHLKIYWYLRSARGLHWDQCMNTHFGLSPAKLRALALLPALTLSACAQYPSRVDADADGHTGTETGVEAGFDAGDVVEAGAVIVDVPYVDHPIPVDSQCAPMDAEDPIFVAESPEEDTRVGNMLDAACQREIGPHLNQRCAQPGYSCGIPNSGTYGWAYVCPTTCPMRWSMFGGSAGPLSPPSLLGELG